MIGPTWVNFTESSFKINMLNYFCFKTVVIIYTFYDGFNHKTI